MLIRFLLDCDDVIPFLTQRPHAPKSWCLVKVKLSNDPGASYPAMAENKPPVDYSLYLVTGRDLLPEGKVGVRTPRMHTSIDVISLGLFGVLGTSEVLCTTVQDCVLIGPSQSIKGGVTLVQIREKHADTGEVRKQTLEFKCPYQSPVAVSFHRPSIQADLSQTQRPYPHQRPYRHCPCDRCRWRTPWPDRYARTSCAQVATPKRHHWHDLQHG